MNDVLALRYTIIKLKSEKVWGVKRIYIFETIHKIFADPMGIIPKVRNAIREKKCTSRLACSEKAWCPLCITSRRLSNQTCCYISSELWKDGQSFFCCCHAVFQGVSRRLNNGVHFCVDVSAVFTSRKLSLTSMHKWTPLFSHRETPWNTAW